MSSGHVDVSSDEDGVDWIANVIRKLVDDDDDDDDDVVVIGEVNGKSKRAAKEEEEEEDDDDCVVLDGDPDKAVAVENDGSDDLVVVGQKGQIACRDYPHPRHLCARFPFTSTPHEKHCHLCHCYVCDSLAPCVHWGTGTSKVGHCNATEKVDMWKTMRKTFKIGRSVSMPAIKVSLPKTSHQIPPRLELNSVQQPQVYRRDVPAFSSVSPNVPAPTSVPLKQYPRSSVIRPCPSTTILNSSAMNPVRSNQQKSLSSTNGAQTSSVQPSLSSEQMLRDVQRIMLKAHKIGNGGLHRTSSPKRFKKVGTVPGPSSNNQSKFGSTCTRNVNPSQYGAVNDKGCTNPSQYGRNSSPMVNGRIGYSWQEVHNSLNQMPSLPVNSGVVGSALPPIRQSANRQNSQPGNQVQNASQNMSLQEIGLGAVDLGFSDCNYSWMNNTGNSIPQQQPPIKNSQAPITEAVFPPGILSYGVSNLQGFESDFDSWLLKNQIILPAPNDSMPSQPDIMSSGPPVAFYPVMSYVDYETSFNSQTEV